MALSKLSTHSVYRWEQLQANIKCLFKVFGMVNEIPRNINLLFMRLLQIRQSTKAITVAIYRHCLLSNTFKNDGTKIKGMYDTLLVQTLTKEQ